MSTAVYKVMVNSDTTEGRGPMVVNSCFSDEDEAWKYANTIRGIMGRFPVSGTWRTEKYGDVTVVRQTVYASFEEAVAVKDGEARKAALAKLTWDERALLGLENV